VEYPFIFPILNLPSFQDAFPVLTTGRNNMPNFTGALTPEQLSDVSAFVVRVVAMTEAE